jgi:trans-aconitate 2-methyltransferase
MAWDPGQYLRFAADRSRPGKELLARIPDVEASTIVDLGCGTGSLTSLLARRWPAARVVGIDASPEMIERARADHPDVEWVLGDIATWEPDGPVDLIFSNATLHWLDDHETVFRRIRSRLAPDGVIAVQMPDNWAAPTHRIPADVLDHGHWPPAARAALLRDRLSRPIDYARWIQPAEVDLWRTTYFQRLTGADPVWHWVTGSVLRPVIGAMDDDEASRFTETCKARYRAAYPVARDGTTTLPFSRLFLVGRATTPG